MYQRSPFPLALILCFSGLALAACDSSEASTQDIAALSASPEDWKACFELHQGDETTDALISCIEEAGVSGGSPGAGDEEDCEANYEACNESTVSSDDTTTVANCDAEYAACSGWGDDCASAVASCLRALQRGEDCTIEFESCSYDGDSPVSNEPGKTCEVVVGENAQPPSGCDANEYCVLQDGVCLDEGSHEGVCAPKPNICNEIYAPVCGCDGEVYGNSCAAESAGVNIASNEASDCE